MLYHLVALFWFLLVFLAGFRACAFRSSFRVDDATFVTMPDVERDAELILENMNDQQQGKHLLDHFCSYMNS